MMSILMVVTCFITGFSRADDHWSGPTKKANTGFQYFMHTGFTFDAVLKTGIFSFNLATPVIAEIESDVSYLGKVVVPKGSKIIGTSSVVKSADRVNVNFNTVVFPNGYEIAFQGIALDTNGVAGIRGKVKKQRATLPAQVILGSVGTAVGASTGLNVAGEVTQAIAEGTRSELAEKQSYSIEVKQGNALQVYVNSRVEY